MLLDRTMAAVTDARRNTVARSDALNDAWVGKPAADETGFSNRESGLWRGVGQAGIDEFAAYHGIDSAPGWKVIVAEPVAVFADAWLWPLLGLGIGGVAALLLGGGLAVLMAKRILLPVRQLAAHARAVAREERGGAAAGATAAQLPPAPIQEVEELRQGFAAAEAALRQSQSHLRSVVEAAADGIVVADGRGRIVSVNSAGMRMFAYDRPEDLLGQDLGVLMPSSEATRHGAIVAAHRAGAPPRVIGVPGRELVAVRRDGTSSRSTCRSVRSAATRRCSWWVSSATPPPQAGRGGAGRERSAASPGPGGRAGRHLRVGPADRHAGVERAHARAMGIAAGRAGFDEHLLHGGASPGCTAAAGRGLPRRSIRRAAAITRPNTESIDQRDGVERHIAARGRVEFAGGQAVRMNGMAIDVTALRRATEALSREAERLAQLAERRGRALAESEARLAEAARMEALGRLAGGIAHDFNNVLQAIQGRLSWPRRSWTTIRADASATWNGQRRRRSERGAP